MGVVEDSNFAGGNFPQALCTRPRDLLVGELLSDRDWNQFLCPYSPLPFERTTPRPHPLQGSQPPFPSFGRQGSLKGPILEGWACLEKGRKTWGPGWLARSGYKRAEFYFRKETFEFELTSKAPLKVDTSFKYPLIMSACAKLYGSGKRGQIAWGHAKITTFLLLYCHNCTRPKIQKSINGLRQTFHWRPIKFGGQHLLRQRPRRFRVES